jgi:hypothetical protein
MSEEKWTASFPLFNLMKKQETNQNATNKFQRHMGPASAGGTQPGAGFCGLEWREAGDRAAAGCPA